MMAEDRQPLDTALDTEHCVMAEDRQPLNTSLNIAHDGWGQTTVRHIPGHCS